MPENPPGRREKWLSEAFAGLHPFRIAVFLLVWGAFALLYLTRAALALADGRYVDALRAGVVALVIVSAAAWVLRSRRRLGPDHWRTSWRAFGRRLRGR